MAERRRRRAGWASSLGPGSIEQAQNRALDALRAPRGRKTVFDAPTAFSALVGASMREKTFQAHIRGYLEERGWFVVVVPDMRKTVAGWPDLCFWHPARPGRLFCWELKREGRYPTAKQRAALAHLTTVPGVDARVVRPADWPGLRDGLLEEV